jgi:hypothetical protein
LLAPDAKGESRGEKFGENSLALDPAKGKPVIILMGKYQALLPEFQATYPGGIVISGPPHWQNPSQPIYISYVLDIAA